MHWQRKFHAAHRKVWHRTCAYKLIFFVVGILSIGICLVNRSGFGEKLNQSIRKLLQSKDFYIQGLLCLPFQGNFIDSLESSASTKNRQMEILELSMWYNSSSNWRTPNVVFDIPVAQSFDRPSEFYVVGGYRANINHVWRRIQKLDVNGENSRWIELQNVTIPAHLATTHIAVFIKNGRLYMFTGQLDYGCGPATRSSAYLDLATKQWNALPDVPEARYAPLAVISHNHVHLFGGAKPDRVTSALDYWMLNLDDPDRGWFPGPSMPQSGDHGQRALIGDWIYSFAFEHGHAPLQPTHKGTWDGKQQILCPGEYLARSDFFKIHAGSIAKTGDSSKWIRLSDIPRPVSHASSIVLDDRWILLVGGIGPVGDRHVSHVQLFDSHSNQWRSLSPLPVPMKSPLLWMNEEQSTLYLQACSSSTKCLNYQAHILWSHQPTTERCLFYTDLPCTTRQLRRTPLTQYDRTTESRWTRLFSNIYLLNMPKSVDRLRQAWSQLNRMGLTSLTLFEAFRVDHMERTPVLIRDDLLWTEKMKQWKAKNDTKGAKHFVLSQISLKLAFMNLWTRNSKKENSISLENKPVLIMEDDLKFIRSREETLSVVERVLTFLGNHSEIEWDLLFLGYRNIEATRSYQISEKPTIHLWRASNVLATTTFIVNKDRRTIDRLNQCYLTRLSAVDQAISSCVKSQLLRAFLIEPKLVEAAPGFSFNLNHFQDYGENRKEHIVGNHTPPATFNSSTED